jgi:amino acid adenylation domain-containing protein
MQQVIEGFRLSPQQTRLWFEQHDSNAYHAQCTILIDGPLNKEVLNDSLLEVINRHEVLRTTYHQAPGVRIPVQVISDFVRFYTPVEVDLRHLSEAGQQARLREIQLKERQRAFLLEQGPLLNINLIALSEWRLCLIADLPALCADSVTLINLAQEISTSYEALLGGLELSAEPLQYAQFAEWQLEMESKREAVAQVEPQADSSAAIQLPFEVKPGAGSSFEPRVVELNFEEDLSERGDSLNSFFLACWLVFLHRVTSLNDLTISYLYAGREFEELQSTFGLLAEAVAIDMGFVSDTAFSEVQERTQEAVEQARNRHVDQADGPRVSYEFEERPGPFGGSGVSFSIADLYCCSYRYKIRLHCIREPERARCELHYDAAIFSAETVSAFAETFREIVRDALKNSQKPIGELNILSPGERLDLLETLAGPRSDYPRETCLHHLIEAQVESNPHNVAVECGKRELTYSELNARANQLAHYLRSGGVGQEVRVGICLQRSPEMMIALLGVLKSGGAYVPMDPADPEERLAYILFDSQVKILLTEKEVVDRLPEGIARTICLDADEELIRAESEENPTGTALPDNLAYVIYTSGSTGKPKGTLITHRGAVNYLWWARDYYQVKDGNGAIVFSPITFDMVVTSLFAPLLARTKVRLIADESPLDGLVESVKIDRELSFVKLTPAHLEMMAQEIAGEAVSDWSRAFIVGGEALMAESISFWRRNAPQTRIINEYGPTETVVGCCVYEVAQDTPATGPVSIGWPTANTQLYVLDNRMQLVPKGFVGELFISGDGVARGYHNRPSLTAERFLPDPFSGTPGLRMYKTGDLTRLSADAGLDYLGRHDQQLKIRGYRIEPGEVETVLRQHPSVREALVLAQEEKRGEKRLVAYVVLDKKRGVSISELRSFVSTQLPEYMVPAYFIKLDAFPLARSGKVDRKALPSPDGVRPDIEDLYIPPRTLIEETLCAIWSEVLGIERVGIDDNFFALGGDSIRSIQVRAKALRKGLNIENRHLFQHHTIRALARVVAFADAGAIEAVKTEPFSLVSDADRVILGDDVEDAYPLTKLQAGMIFHTEFSPDSAVYHDMHSFHIKARLDLDVLEKALNQTIARHPELRTSFDLRRFGVPLQLVHKNVRANVGYEDQSHLAGEELRGAIEQRLEQEKELHFNYEQAPLHRFHIIRRNDEEFQFMLIFHHAILDGWSAATLLTELFHRYLSLLHNPEIAPEPPLAISFRDFASLEKMTLESEQAQDYWNRVLSDTSISMLPRWPSSYRDESARQAQFKMVQIPEEVSAGLKELARSASVPIKNVLLAAHMKVMGMLSGHMDVMTGLIANGRPEEADGDRVLGLFLNAVPFRLNLAEGTWIDLVRETFMRERELLPFRRYPLAELQRKNGGQPLFETNFNFMHYHVYQRLRGIEEVEVIDYEGYEETNFTMMAQFSLDLGSSDVRLGLNYHPKALPPEQVDAIATYYVNTLTAMAGDPLQLHHSFNALSQHEQTRLLDEWNPRVIKDDGQRCITDLFVAQAQATPKEIALVSDDRVLTYEQLDQMSNRVANYLVSLGVKPEVKIAIYMERSAELMIGLLGILKAGGAYVALDTTHPLERLAFILDEALPPVILTQEKLVDDLPSFFGQVLCLDSEWDVIEGYEEQRPGVAVNPENLAYVLYTSGSTGKPKGVMVTHRGFANYLTWATEHYGAGEGRGSLCHSPVSFDLTVTSLFTPLLAGKSVVLAALDNGVESLALALRNDTDFSLIKITPAHLDLLTELLPPSEVARRVRCLVIGGEALFTEKLDLWRTNAPETRIVNEYGPTETVVGCCVYEVNGDATTSGPVPIGQPIQNTRLYVLDRNLQPVPIAVTGELYIAGAGLARGYVNSPEVTAQSFVPDPFANTPGERMYKTGDLARYLPDGNIEYVGRNDEQVKIRGYRIELGEIEAAINAGGGVKQCVVVVKGEAERRALVAYVVPEEDRELTGEEIKEQLRSKLPEYMVPVRYVFLEELPVTDNGKVDRRALPDTDDDQRKASTYQEGRNETERELANIWQAVLGVERVGINDNFFDLGGHSLLAIQVISRVRNVLNVDLPLRALFDSPTVATLAELIAKEQPAGGVATASHADRIPARSRVAGPAPLESRESQDIETLLSGLESLQNETAVELLDQAEDFSEPLDVNPLSLSQERVWRLEEQRPGTTHYTMRSVLRLTGALNVAVLQRAFDEMVRRHETLRTLFTVRDGKPVQVVNEPRPFTLPQIDLITAEPSLRETMAQQLFLSEVRRPFVLSEGPPVRAVLIKQEEESHILVIVLHQLISDAWALNVFITEVTVLYSAFIEGRPSPLPALPIQYADFARWEQQRFASGELDSQLDHWRQQLAHNFTLANIPTDRPFPEIASTRGAGETLVLPPQTVEAFRAFTRGENVSLYMSMLTAFKVLLYHLCRQDDISVMTGVAGRTREETERLIGSFANALVLRTDLSGDPTFREALQRVSKVSLEALANQDVPFNLVEQMVRESSGIVDKQLFQIVFDLTVTNDNNATRALVQNVSDLRVEMLVPDEDLVTGAAVRLSIDEVRQDVIANLFYRRDVFDAPTIAGWLKSYLQLLDAVVQNPDARISELGFVAAHAV